MDKKRLILIGGIVAAVIGLIIFNIRNSDNLSFYQTDDIIKSGNKIYDQSDYANALKEYRKVSIFDSLNSGAEYNKGNAEFMKKQPANADSLYKNAARIYLEVNKEKQAMVDDENLSHIYHNKGNANMAQTMPIDSVIMYQEMAGTQNGGESTSQDPTLQQAYPALAKSWEKAKNAINDYENALRRDCKNDSTRFNLALAQDYEKRLRDILQNMTPPQNQNQQNNQNQDNKDKQDQQEQKEQKDQQNQQDNPNDEKKETDEKNGQKDDNIPDLSKENAEQILKAMEKDEENTLKKMRLQRNKNQQRKHIEKNW